MLLPNLHYFPLCKVVPRLEQISMRKYLTINIFWKLPRKFIKFPSRFMPFSAKKTFYLTKQERTFQFFKTLQNQMSPLVTNMSCSLPAYKVVITCIVFFTGFLPVRGQFVIACCGVLRTSLCPGVLACCGAGTVPLSIKEFGLQDLQSCQLSWLPFKLPSKVLCLVHV